PIIADETTTAADRLGHDAMRPHPACGDGTGGVGHIDRHYPAISTPSIIVACRITKIAHFSRNAGRHGYGATATPNALRQQPESAVAVGFESQRFGAQISRYSATLPSSNPDAVVANIRAGI